MGIERELKFSLGADAAAALPGHPLLRLAGTPCTQGLSTLYFDTADARLAAAGMALRQRRSGDGLIVTVKSAGADAFGLQRGEWEWQAAGIVDDALHPTDVARAWAQTPLHDLASAAAALQASLRPVYGTRFERRSWQLACGHSLVEVALDRGHCMARRDGVEHHAPLCELELELKQGRLDDIWDLAWALAQDLPLQLSPTNKAQRAAALAAGTLIQPPREAPNAEAAQAVDWLSADCARLCVWAERIGSADAVEDVHQFRVVARRVRSALRWCEPDLPAHSRRWFTSELRWAMQLAAPVREADVLLPRLPPGAAELLRAERDLQRDALRAYLVGPRWGRLLLALARWAQIWESRIDGDDLRERAPSALKRAHRRWRALRAACLDTLRQARSGQLPKGDAALGLHALRIQTKRLRLACERLGPYAVSNQAEPWKALAGRCAELQSLLGHWHDAERLIELLPAGPLRFDAARQALLALHRIDLG